MAKTIGDALRHVERSRPIPKSPEAQLNFLIRQAKGSTRELADMLGVSPRQALRYRKGEAKLPEAKLRREVTKRWQPRVRQRIRRQIAQQGLVVAVQAQIGYTAAPGTTDDPRVRSLVQPLTPEYGRRLLDARTEGERLQVLGQALGELYFRDGGTRARGLEAEVTDLDNITITL